MGRRRTPIARWSIRAAGHAGSSRAPTWRIFSLSRSTTTPFCIRRRFSRADADAVATGAAVCGAQNREAPRHFASGRSWACFEDKWRLAPIALGVKRSCSVLRLALAFHGFDAVMGQTYEVWFIKGDFLYEVSTYKELEPGLNEIMSTWRFI